MPGDWIKVEIDTPHKPEVLKLARILGIHKAQAFGLVVTFWGWCDKNTSDGQIIGVTEEDIDIFVAQPGFTKAMQEVKWLDFDAKIPAINVPSFDIHNSESAKKRAQKSRRQQKWRTGAKEEAPAERKPKPENKRELPADWNPSEKTLADLQGEYQWKNGDAEKYIAAFRDACASKGYKYADFDAAFRNCVRSDWPKLRPAAGNSAQQDRYNPRKAQM